MRILLALDDSKFSEAAVKTSVTQFNPTGVEVCLLNIIEPFPATLAEKVGSREAPDFVGARSEERARGRKMLSRAEKTIRSAGFKVTSIVKEGDPRDIILDYADSWNADLIVLGSHGRRGLNRFLMGSVSEAVSRHARCSVEIIRIWPSP